MNIRLGLCSAYSFHYGVHKPGELLERAAAFGVKTVSVCDVNNLYGVHAFVEGAKEKGIRAIIGAALTIGNGFCKTASMPFYKNRVFAPQKLSLKQTNTAIRGGGEQGTIFCFVESREGFGRLCEILTLRNRDKEGFNPLPLLVENAGGLVVASPDGFILERLAGKVKRLYGALMPSCIGAVGPSRKFNVPLCFLDTSLFLEKTDYAVHRVLRAIGLLKTVGNLAPGDTAEEKRILSSSKELHRLLVSYPEAVKGTEEIVDVCGFNELFDGWIFPGYEIGEPVGEVLRRRVYEGAAARYGELGDRELERIDYELGIIEKKGFSSYFLTIDDIVKTASRTCGRGSGAASVVSYALGITNIDPLAHDLYFERFLNPARPDPPDLDIDFAWDERDELLKAVIERFGPSHCARVANHNFFRCRGALRETAKAYGFGDGDITRMLRKEGLGNKELGNGDNLWKEIMSIARRIEGLPHGLGMHCGGLVITPGPIYKSVPVETSAEGFPLLAWEKGNRDQGNEDLRLVLQRATDDKAVIAALARGDSMGVFYIESPAMRQLQKKTGAGDFGHIVIHSSIIRPAANKFIAEYVRRLKGGAWEPLHPRLETILKETYGILCYQEDVSKTAVALAGFDEAEADSLRKIIAKKAGGTKLAGYKEKFFEGCRKNGVTGETIQKIWEMMLSFDGYSFCKPHSASYAMVSFQSAYLRVHYPACFMAAVLSNQGGYYRPHAYIAECRRMGLVTEGPDINISRWKYYGKKKSVVIGLMAVRGLSSSGAEAIIHERERGGDFTSLDDFVRRVRLGRDDIIALCPAGVFDGIAGGLCRTMQTRKLLSMRNEGGGNEKLGIRSEELFSIRNEEVGKSLVPHSSFPIPNSSLPHSSLPTPNSSLWEEYRALGFLRGVHPLALWKDDVLGVKGRVKALRLGDNVGRFVCMVGWPVTQKEVWTKDGLTMSFLSLEDETGLYETVIFPKVYERYGRLLFDQRPLLVYGRVVEDEGAISLEVGKIEVLGIARNWE